MQVTIQGRGINVREDLKRQITRELEKLRKFHDRITGADVVLEGKLHQKEAQIRLGVPEQTLVATSMADKFEVAVKDAVDKLSEQVKRYKEKLRGR